MKKFDFVKLYFTLSHGLFVEVLAPNERLNCGGGLYVCI